MGNLCCQPAGKVDSETTFEPPTNKEQHSERAAPSQTSPLHQPRPISLTLSNSWVGLAPLAACDKAATPVAFNGKARERQRLPPIGTATAKIKAGPADLHSKASPILKPARRAEGAAGKAVRVPQVPSSFYILRKTENIKNKYFTDDELGRGQFGVVVVGVEKEEGRKYAIKSISKRKADACPHFSKDVRAEVEVLYHLGGHPNIAQLHEVYEDADAIHLVLELCRGGNWFQRLTSGGTFSERQAAKTARTVLETLEYCHSMGVVHRDIKPENLLFTDRTPNASVKLADFGLAAMVPEPAVAASGGGLEGVVGTTFYVAPEVLMARGYGKECDIWSMGVLLFITLGGYPPFDGRNEQKVFNAILYKPLRFEDPTWDQISSGAKDLISRMLIKDPRRRASIPELLAHPWLNPSSSSVTTEAGGSTDAAPGKDAAGDAPGEAAGKLQGGAKVVVVPGTVVTRLQAFAAMNYFKKEARRVLSVMLPEEEVVGLRNIFKEMDTNGDGMLTLAELRAGMQRKGLDLQDKPAEELLHCVDLNNDGVIDYEEFLAATVHQLRLEKDEHMFKAFQAFDKDGSGFITEAELRDALKYQTQVDVDAIIREIDADRDGRINYEEFCNFVRMRDQGNDNGAGLGSPRPPGLKSFNPNLGQSRVHFREPERPSHGGTGGQKVRQHRRGINVKRASSSGERRVNSNGGRHRVSIGGRRRPSANGHRVSSNGDRSRDSASSARRMLVRDASQRDSSNKAVRKAGGHGSRREGLRAAGPPKRRPSGKLSSSKAGLRQSGMTRDADAHEPGQAGFSSRRIPVESVEEPDRASAPNHTFSSRGRTGCSPIILPHSTVDSHAGSSVSHSHNSLGRRAPSRTSSLSRHSRSRSNSPSGRAQSFSSPRSRSSHCPSPHSRRFSRDKNSLLIPLSSPSGIKHQLLPALLVEEVTATGASGPVLDL